MRRITSVLDSSYIGLPYWTAWQAPKNIVSSSPAPRSREASLSTPSFVVSVLRGDDGWTDALLRHSPRLFSSPHPSSMGDLWQYQIALSSHGCSFTPSFSPPQQQETKATSTLIPFHFFKLSFKTNTASVQTSVLAPFYTNVHEAHTTWPFTYTGHVHAGGIRNQIIY